MLNEVRNSSLAEWRGCWEGPEAIGQAGQKTAKPPEDAQMPFSSGPTEGAQGGARGGTEFFLPRLGGGAWAIPTCKHSEQTTDRELPSGAPPPCFKEGAPFNSF